MTPSHARPPEDLEVKGTTSATGFVAGPSARAASAGWRSRPPGTGTSRARSRADERCRFEPRPPTRRRDDRAPVGRARRFPHSVEADEVPPPVAFGGGPGG